MGKNEFENRNEIVVKTLFDVILIFMTETKAILLHSISLEQLVGCHNKH